MKHLEGLIVLHSRQISDQKYISKKVSLVFSHKSAFCAFRESKSKWNTKMSNKWEQREADLTLLIISQHGTTILKGFEIKVSVLTKEQNLTNF